MDEKPLLSGAKVLSMRCKKDMTIRDYEMILAHYENEMRRMQKQIHKLKGDHMARLKKEIKEAEGNLSLRAQFE